VPRKCYSKRRRYPSPFSGTPVPRPACAFPPHLPPPSSFFLAASILAAARYDGGSPLDNKGSAEASSDVVAD